MDAIALSQHFTLLELCRSSTASEKGIENTPALEDVDRLRSLCRLLLEPARSLLGVPLDISSGFRCPELNRAVGGSPSSVHPLGLAADFRPRGLDLADAFRRLAGSDLPFDQLLYERGCIHVGLPRSGAPRRMVGAWSQAGGLKPWQH